MPLHSEQNTYVKREMPRHADASGEIEAHASTRVSNALCSFASSRQHIHTRAQIEPGEFAGVLDLWRSERRIGAHQQHGLCVGEVWNKQSKRNEGRSEEGFHASRVGRRSPAVADNRGPDC